MVGDGFELFRKIKNLRRFFSCLIWDRRGNIGALTALLILPMAGGIALATEASGWYMVNRVAQNAADAAALAAASNNDYPGTGYQTEGAAVATKYGFTDGTNHATVLVTWLPTAPVAGCASGCYEAKITQAVPLFFANIVGYAGNANYSGVRGQSIQAGALAVPKTALVDDCITSLGNGNDAIRFNGAPKADLTGCTLKANGNVKCDGNSTNFKIVIYGGKDDKCEPSKSGASFTDPYAGAYTVPANTCMSYPGTIGGGFPATQVCGSWKLTSNVTVNAGNQVLVIENGVLDLNGYTLSTASGAGLTIVFSGTNGGGYSHYVTGSGTLDIAAPTSGSWSGVAIYDDPILTSGVDFTYTGNSPTWDITGLVYVPNANVEFKGAIDKASNGVNCFALVDNTLLVDGTGSIFANSQSQCHQAGLTPPQSLGLVGAQLVY
jgi:hypothetical protein